ncbi:MAG: efflux RND transporter periplasmic adaptor subunit [Ruminococcus sp.]|nr:efflux RND transporter periplasmic adaptor subunit [Ruminococcus sp.]MCM1479520.1 efflux RND transporter periplasmic adaptor subunit [Muribaculaceae bacterium]
MKAKKIIVPVSIIAGIAVIGTAVAMLSNSAANVTYADTVKITQKELENKISVSGTVQSSEKKNVYSKLNYPVEKINVSVGDAVKKGDVLCTISTEELQQQILQQQATVESSGINSDYTLSDIEQKYADALADYNAGRNSVLVNAQKAVDQAEKALEDAKRQEQQGIGTTLPSNIQNADAQIKNAEQQLESAKLNYDNAVKAYNDAEDALKPENYSGDLKDLSAKVEEYEDYYVKVQKKKQIPELVDAKKEFEKAEEKYYEMTRASEEAAAYGFELYTPQETEKITSDYQKAKQKYDEAVEKFKLENVEEQLKSLRNQLENSIDALEKARDSAKLNMDTAKNSVDSAQLAYDRAVSDYENTGKVNENTSEGYGIAVKNAEDALETAKKDYDLAVQQVEAELASLKKQAEQQRTISGLNDPQVIILQNYKDKLEYAVVTAPCDGIITAVNAEEGAAATGALFTIEDLDSLVISASVGEYDIPYITEGMEAVIRCDALGSAEFNGKITDVAPTGAAGMSNSGVSYKIEASVEGDGGRLYTGMTAKLNIISEKKAGALTVTYDALATDGDGNDVVYIAEKDETGVYRAKKVVVTVGLETDYEAEIISSELKDGMFALTNTELLEDGMVVNVGNTESGAEQ